MYRVYLLTSPYVVFAPDSFFRRSLRFVNVFFVFPRGLVFLFFFVFGYMAVVVDVFVRSGPSLSLSPSLSFEP